MPALMMTMVRVINTVITQYAMVMVTVDDETVATALCDTGSDHTALSPTLCLTMAIMGMSHHLPPCMCFAPLQHVQDYSSSYSCRVASEAACMMRWSQTAITKQGQHTEHHQKDGTCQGMPQQYVHHQAAFVTRDTATSCAPLPSNPPLWGIITG